MSPLPSRAGLTSTGAVDLLELARSLAKESGAARSSSPKDDTHNAGVGEKGDKHEKSPEPGIEALPGPPPAFPNDPEVAWRARGMWSQIRAESPIPFLVALDLPSVDGACLSCGVPLSTEERYRCAICLKAAVLVLVALQDSCMQGGSPR